MQQFLKPACSLMLFAALGVFASCGNGGQPAATDSTGTTTDSLMSNTGASGNASPGALPGDTTHAYPDSSLTDTSKSSRP